MVLTGDVTLTADTDSGDTETSVDLDQQDKNEFRLWDNVERVNKILEPFVNILTVIVQALTAWVLVRKL